MAGQPTGGSIGLAAALGARRGKLKTIQQPSRAQETGREKGYTFDRTVVGLASISGAKRS